MFPPAATERVSAGTEYPAHRAQNPASLTSSLPPRSGTRHGQRDRLPPSSPAESDAHRRELRADGTGARPVRMSADSLM